MFDFFRYFFRRFLFISILLSFFVQTSFAVRIVEVNEDGGPATVEGELEQAMQEFEQAKDEFDDALPGLEKLKSEFDEFLKDIDLNDSGWFKSFRNKVLYSVPLDEEVSVGIYGADVLKFLFFVSYIYLDKVLFDQLKNYYKHHISGDFKNKKDLLVTLYEEKVSPRLIKDFISDAKAKKTFIDECCIALDLNVGLNYKLFSYIFFNLMEKEGVKFVEHQIFPVVNSSLMDFFKNAEKLGKTENRVISFYPVIDYILMINFLGYLPGIEDTLRTSRSFLLKMAGWDYKTLNNYGIDLTRRMLILILFLNRLNVWYQNLFKEYLNQNLEEFLRVLSGIKMAQVSDANNMQEQDEALKDFTQEGLDCSFKKWFDYKTRCCAKFGILIEGIILSPVICKGGYFIYNNFIRKA